MNKLIAIFQIITALLGVVFAGVNVVRSFASSHSVGVVGFVLLFLLFALLIEGGYGEYKILTKK